MALSLFLLLLSIISSQVPPEDILLHITHSHAFLNINRVYLLVAERNLERNNSPSADAEGEIQQLMGFKMLCTTKPTLPGPRIP